MHEQFLFSFSCIRAEKHKLITLTSCEKYMIASNKSILPMNSFIIEYQSQVFHFSCSFSGWFWKLSWAVGSIVTAKL